MKCMPVAICCMTAVLLLVACEQKADPHQFEVRWHRDYKDVAVVVNAARSDEEAPSLIADIVPYARIDEASGADLGAIAHVKRLSTGEIVIADSFNKSVVIFSADGHLIRNIGRSGDGPCEFRQLGGLHVLPGDTLMLFAPPDRLIRMHVTGECAYETRVPGPPPRPLNDVSIPSIYSWDAIQPLESGGVLVQFNPEDIASGETYQRATFLYGIARSGSQLVIDTIGWFASGVAKRFSDRDVRLAHFSPMSWAAVGRRYVYAGDGSLYDIGQYNLDGQLTRRIQRDAESQKVSRADRILLQRDLERRGAASDAEPEVMATHPKFWSLVVDDRDHLWVQESHSRYSEVQRWAEYDTTGQHVGDVILPFPITARVLRIDSSSVFLLRPETVTPELELYRRVRN